MEKKTNEKTVEIVGILDRSGSMGHLIDETITGYNAFIKEQRKVGPAKVTLAIFDDRYDVLYDRLDINDVPKLTKNDFFARGMTALRDAVGKTVNAVHGSQRNGTKPDKTLVFIVTDGEENNSSEFTQDEIKKLVKKRTKKDWEFFFMGADIDAFAGGYDMGIGTHNIVTTSKTKSGVRQSYRAVSNTANLYRSGGTMSAAYAMTDMYDDSGDDSPGDVPTATPSWSDLPVYKSNEEEDE